MLHIAHLAHLVLAADTAAASDPSAMIVTAFLSHGVIGAVALIALWAYWQKDKQLAVERDARLNDGKEMLKMYYELSAESEKTLETAVNLILKQQKGP